ncbi:hypothetical protein M422DRAFT_230797 [Sphaerobolus stellatus SS14]|uniref:Exosome complex protein n=1 Tax=Sphaerobolus stellatus (strain SS14) TaxID=990650 RepID=A0A0C9VNG7_SPHS4|nr:hypothetical protein M422DRAFT_230797 [Sphaerobolus stellatus SS14]
MESLSALEDSLDNLEEVLGPLFEKPLFDISSELDLLQKAKLQVLLPYVVNDLIFVYLKTRGINPKEHPVVAELDRIKQYFAKIKNAEDPEKRKFAVDQQAASRFIKHAIKETQKPQPQTQRLMPQGSNTKFTNVVVEGAKASIAALAKIEARNAEEDAEGEEEEDSELEVYEEGGLSKDANGDKGKGKEAASSKTAAPAPKKRRQGIDPWQGYVEANLSASGTENPDEPPTKKARSSPSPGDDESASTPMDVDSGTATPVEGGSKKKKQKKKKNGAIGALQAAGGSETPDLSGQEDSTTTSLAGTPVPSGASTPQPQGKPKKKKKQKQTTT